LEEAGAEAELLQLNKVAKPEEVEVEATCVM
jgi:hypothetical protein